MPSTTKFKLSNFVVEHAIVIFKHAIVQLKYEIRNGMLILLFNMKPLIGLFKANIHYETMAFVFEGHSIQLWCSILNCTLQLQYAMRHSECAVTLFYGRHRSKIIPLPWPVVRQCINIKWISFLRQVIKSKSREGEVDIFVPKQKKRQANYFASWQENDSL